MENSVKEVIGREIMNVRQKREEINLDDAPPRMDDCWHNVHNAMQLLESLKAFCQFTREMDSLGTTVPVRTSVIAIADDALGFLSDARDSLKETYGNGA
jgi:hypothetical protein